MALEKVERFNISDSLKYKLNNTIYTSKNILNKVGKIIKEL